MFRVEIHERREIFKQLVDAFWGTTFSPSAIAKAVHGSGAKQVGKGKFTEELRRKDAEEKNVGRAYLFCLVRGVVRAGKERFGT